MGVYTGFKDTTKQWQQQTGQTQQQEQQADTTNKVGVSPVTPAVSPARTKDFSVEAKTTPASQTKVEQIRSKPIEMRPVDVMPRAKAKEPEMEEGSENQYVAVVKDGQYVWENAEVSEDMSLKDYLASFGKYATDDQLSRAVSWQSGNFYYMLYPPFTSEQVAVSYMKPFPNVTVYTDRLRAYQAAGLTTRGTGKVITGFSGSSTAKRTKPRRAVRESGGDVTSLRGLMI